MGEVIQAFFFGILLFIIQGLGALLCVATVMFSMGCLLYAVWVAFASVFGLPY